MPYSIGIDIGTTNVKCVLFKEGCVVAAETSKEYKTLLTQPLWVQQDPNDWWNGVVESIQVLLAKSWIDPEDIKVMAISCQAPTVLPVDKKGRPLHDALIWMDRRSKEECELIKEKIGSKRVFEITGNRLDTYFCLTELMWFIRNHPEIMEKCYKILQINGYVNYKLTGEFSIDESHVSITQMYDIHNKCWSEELLNAIGADVSIMPPVYACYDPIGTVSKKAAEATGLSKSTVVLAGTVDVAASALETGVFEGGKAAEMAGTSSVVIIDYDKLIIGGDLSYLKGICENSRLLFGPMNTAGGSLKWFRDALYGGETEKKDAYIRMNKEIEKKAKNPSKLIFLPYMAGERAPIWDLDARGAFIGLNLNTNRAEMMRSIMEGTCFALRDNLEQAYKLGVSVHDLICCGGCTNSEIWLKIKASVIKKEIKLPEVNLGAPGGLAYMMAAYMGEYASAEEASKCCLRIKRTIEPVQEWIKIYDEMYHIYKDSYLALSSQFKALSKL